ncbi:MAG: SMP-30/gluconolactonase/LRE family protein [Alphaproteobacteria bacterium]|jgi:gluconolactonase|nr:SMP-30/gluconolactonase/LRE family protein [Alphaproteobacteria bacterium]MDP6567059.1 SMP-30/gluconolactonase/LRE family protein [Alphaproteobacteria bacterium]MDP6812479.1 SMP-30/gluconolactonase/LRE family protein [Alphaproteobacteria bacterium]
MEKLAEGYGLIEGPVWDGERGLLYSDVINGGVFCLDAGGAVSQVFGHRRGIGGMALHRSGGLVVSGRNISLKPAGDGETRVLLDNDPDGGVIGFNDLTTDAKGRVYAGSLAFRPVGADDTPKPGSLYCIDLDGSARVVGEDVMLTNGLGVSPDGRLLYHSESLRHIVRVYEVAEDGGLGPHRSFAPVEDGVPDGLAVAVDGSVWVAVAHGSRVDVFEPDGSLRRSIPCDIPMVTSVCFGGADLSDLYVVTGTDGTGRDDAGAVFRLRTEVAGLALAPAAVSPA